MARKPHSHTEFVLFDVLYADGTRSSNRRVPANLLGGLDGDEPAQAFIEAQEQEIAKASGRPLRQIASMTRSGAKPDRNGAGKSARGGR